MKGFLFFDPLKRLDFIVHGFSTKPQGFKTAEEAMAGLGLDDFPSVVPKQVHGTDIVFADDGKVPVRPVADGAITKTLGIVLVVKVADCVPIYLVDPRTPAIGLIHAGWRKEDARQFLYIGIDASIVHTANFREWRHIFSLRCDRAAHWEIRTIMLALQTEFSKRWPCIFSTGAPA